MDDIITHFPFYNRTYEHVHGVNHSAFRPLRRRKRYYQTYNVFAQLVNGLKKHSLHSYQRHLNKYFA